MRTPVMMKSSRYGIDIYFDRDMPYEELLLSVRERFEASARFFGHAEMAACFKGRSFTEEEALRMTEVIEEAAGIRILCLMDRDGEAERIHKRMLDDSRDALHADGMFYKGTLRERQIFESEKSVVIIGDVEDGATVISGGNVVVTGSVYGTVIAGAGGNYEAVIAASHMRPRRLKIGDVQLKPVIGGSYSWARLL